MSKHPEPLTKIRNALFTALVVVFLLKLAVMMIAPFLPLIFGGLILSGLGAYFYKKHFRL
jgi:hypothetical protein